MGDIWRLAGEDRLECSSSSYLARENGRIGHKLGQLNSDEKKREEAGIL